MARADTQTDPLWQEFHQLVNMTSAELRDWLAASEDVFSQVAPGGPQEEPDGDLPSLGWQVVNVLGKRRTDLTGSDTALMERVVEIVRERLDNPPPGGVNDDAWRRGLMLLGHDPLRETAE